MNGSVLVHSRSVCKVSGFLCKHVCRLHMFIYSSPLGVCVLAFLSVYKFVHVSMSVCVCVSSHELLRVAYTHLISLSLILDLCT